MTFQTSPERSALDLRQDLGKRLRVLRKEAGLTGVQLAHLLGCHSSKISRIELGTAIPSPADVRAWCAHTGAEGEADDLAAQATSVEVAYSTWRRTQHTGGLLRLQEEGVTELFERTRRWRAYESRVLPGILQTVDYASAVLEVTRRRLDRPDDVAAAAEARYGLRRVLDGPAMFAYVIEEHILREPIAGPQVMRVQGEQLLADAQRPNVSIGVIPMGRRERHPIENFTMHDDDMVRVQLLAGRWTAMTPGDIAEYRQVFEELSAVAVHGEEAAALIHDAVG